MKNFFSFLLFISTFFCFSQDVIFMKNGEEINGKVTEIGIHEIQYLKPENKDSVIYFVNKPDVLMIKYASGRKDVFATENKSAENKNPQDMYMKGMMDAAQQYPARKTGAGGVIVTTALTGFLGVIPAGICSAVKPKPHNLGVVDKELFNNNNSYRLGYTKQAHKMKKKKIWGAFGITMAANFIILLALSQ